MNFELLRVDGLRCLAAVTVAPEPGINVFIGSNGAGKTSLLEATSLLSHGRSFRRGGHEALIQKGVVRLSVYSEIRDARDQLHRVGLAREGNAWNVRVDGATTQRISDLIRHCAVVNFEPGSHALIAGPAEERRRFLDWGVFHVEHAFLGMWQQYQRALKQRNALLRGPMPPSNELLVPWEKAMDASACFVNTARKSYLLRLEPCLREVCRQIVPELGELTISYRAGWDASFRLADVLMDQRGKDFARGYTAAGIHRADWRPAFVAAPQREFFSRGQEKLCALACLLAQAMVYANTRNEWPVLCLDDLASELDQDHQATVIALLRDTGAQVFITGTCLLKSLVSTDARVFHVKHGTITAV